VSRRLRKGRSTANRQETGENPASMRSGPSSSSFPSNRRRGFAFVLALALVTVQMLGLAHRVVHADREALAVEAVSISRGTPEGASEQGGLHPYHAAAGGLAALFSGHQGDECDAFDAMSHADLAVDVTLDPVPLPRTVSACFMHAAWQLAAQAQGFLARAPPFAA